MNFLKNLFKPKLTWEQAFQVLTDFENFDDNKFLLAYKTIDELSDVSKIPILYELINHNEFIVREAIAVPLARLEGVKSLPVLLHALVRGEEDGHDNDGLVAIVSGLLENNKTEAYPILKELFNTKDNKLRSEVAWAFGHIAPEVSFEFLLENYLIEENKNVRSALVGALSSYELDERVINILLNRFETENEDVKISIVFTLSYCSDKNIIKKLKSLLEKESNYVQKHTEYILEQAQKY